MEYCKQQFSVTTFLQHKLKYALPKISISTYASKKKQHFSDIPNMELFETLKKQKATAKKPATKKPTQKPK